MLDAELSDIFHAYDFTSYMIPEFNSILNLRPSPKSILLTVVYLSKVGSSLIRAGLQSNSDESNNKAALTRLQCSVQ